LAWLTIRKCDIVISLSMITRDSNGRFCSEKAKSAEQTETNAGSVLEQHRSNLASLRADYERLVSLSGKGATLSAELSSIEGAIEAIAERLLSNGTDGELELELAGKSTRRESLRAQSDLVGRQQRAAETALQRRLSGDITARVSRRIRKHAQVI
jgi:multidrug resistance efflux pump